MLSSFLKNFVFAFERIYLHNFQTFAYKCSLSEFWILPGRFLAKSAIHGPGWLRVFSPWVSGPVSRAKPVLRRFISFVFPRGYFPLAQVKSPGEAAADCGRGLYCSSRSTGKPIPKTGRFYPNTPIQANKRGISPKYK